MPPSHRRPRTSRFASWALVCLLLLKAAVPMFAAGAAAMRGVPVAQVCPIYGVALPGPAGAGHEGHAHHHAEHSGHEEDHRSHHAADHGDHCALTALAGFAPAEAPELAIASAHTASLAPQPAPARGAMLRDATVRWRERLKHGPPSLA